MKSIRLFAMALPCLAALMSSGAPADAQGAGFGFCAPGPVPASVATATANVQTPTFVSTNVSHFVLADACFYGVDASGVETDVAITSLYGTASGNSLQGPPVTELINTVDIFQYDAAGNQIGFASSFDDVTVPQISPGLAGEQLGPATMTFFAYPLNFPAPVTVSATWTAAGPAQHNVQIFAFHMGRINFGDHAALTLQPATVNASVVTSDGTNWLSGLVQTQGNIENIHDQNVAVSP